MDDHNNDIEFLNQHENDNPADNEYDKYEVWSPSVIFSCPEQLNR